MSCQVCKRKKQRTGCRAHLSFRETVETRHRLETRQKRRVVWNAKQISKPDHCRNGSRDRFALLACKCLGLFSFTSARVLAPTPNLAASGASVP
jgi:hypothetical protein